MLPLKNLKKNLKFAKKLVGRNQLIFIKQEGANSPSNFNQHTSQDSSLKNMSPIKSIIIYCIKVICFLFIANLLLIKPLSTSISKGLENFDNNPLIKIISLDFISNPLTFIRLANYYASKGDLSKAALYLQYAETLNARYPYPKEIAAQISELKNTLKKQ